MPITTSRLDARGNLLPEYFPEVSLKGFLCPGCLKPVEFYDGWLLVTNRTIACSCGASYDMFSAKVALTPENPAFELLKEKNLRTASWFHATTEGNWERVLERKGNFTIHVGTEQAAFDRALGIYLSRPPAGFQESFDLYELRLKPQAVIADRIIHDGNFERFLLGRNHVIRYINRWEDPSSISLAGRSNAFELVGKRIVTGTEALERVSIYNVRP